MQLECPKCAARYEIDDAMIPLGGREVQCSACEHIWFQNREVPALGPDRDDAPAPVVEDEPDTEDEGPAPPRRELDAETQAILREEAEREAAARRRAPRPEPKPATRPAPTPPPVPSPATPPKTARANLGSLRSPAPVVAGTRNDPPEAEKVAAPPPPQPRGRASAARHAARRRDGDGFRLGFGLVLVVAVGLILIYAFAPQIADTVPALEPTLERYVGDVNDFRTTLGDWIDGAIEDLRELIGTSA